MKIQDVRPLSTSPIGAFCTCAPRAAVTFRPHVTSPIGLPFHLTSPSNGLNARIFLTVPNSIGRQVVGIGPDRWFPRRSQVRFRAVAARLLCRIFRCRRRSVRGVVSAPAESVFCFPSVASDFRRRRRLLSTTAAVSYRRECVDPARGFFSIHFPPSVKSVFFFFVLPKIIYPFFFTRVDSMCNVIVERLHTAVKRRKHNAFKI